MDFDDAQRKLIWAEEAIDNKQMNKAKRLAQEAYIVAELASARTEYSKVVQLTRSADNLLDGLLLVVGN